MMEEVFEQITDRDCDLIIADKDAQQRRSYVAKIGEREGAIAKDEADHLMVYQKAIEASWEIIRPLSLAIGRLQVIKKISNSPVNVELLIQDLHVMQKTMTEQFKMSSSVLSPNCDIDENVKKRYYELLQRCDEFLEKN